jgi:hypothetical protein
MDLQSEQPDSIVFSPVSGPAMRPDSEEVPRGPGRRTKAIIPVAHFDDHALAFPSRR